MKQRFLFALVCLLASPVLAADDHTGFRVIREETDDGVNLVMQSDYCVEYTVTLEATLKNMTSSRTLPFTVGAAGQKSFVLARFKITDKSQPRSFRYYYHWEYGGRRDSTDND